MTNQKTNSIEQDRSPQVPRDSIPQTSFSNDEWLQLESLLNSGDLEPPNSVSDGVAGLAVGSAINVDEVDDPKSQPSDGEMMTIEDMYKALGDEHMRVKYGEDIRDIIDLLKEPTADTRELRELLEDVSLRLQWRLLAESNVRKAREFSERNLGGEAKVPEEREYTVDPEKFAWITGKSTITVSKHKSPEGNIFWFGDISGQASRTRIDEAFINEKQIEEVHDTIIDHIGQKIDSNDKRHKNLRIFRQSDKIASDSTLTPLKDDSVNPEGFDANQLRALVLEDTTYTDGPLYLFTTACNHGDQQARIYDL